MLRTGLKVIGSLNLLCVALAAHAVPVLTQQANAKSTSPQPVSTSPIKPTQNYHNQINPAQIIAWLSNPQDAQVALNKINIENTEVIQIGGNETAWISSVNFDDAGRNFWGGYILTRPALKKSLLLNKFGGQANEVKVLSRNYQPTLIQLSSAGSGQGDTDNTDYVLSFDGWKAKIYYQADSFSRGFGQYSSEDYPEHRCAEKTTTYKLVDQGAMPAIIETSKTYEGRCLDKIPAKAYLTKTRNIKLKLN